MAMKSRRRKNRPRGGLGGRNILLIVSGGIAAYKSAFLVRLLKRGEAEVRVVMSGAAAEFITPLTFEVLSGNPVGRELFAPRREPGVEHVELSAWADRIVVAPATADIIAKAAAGIADDLPGTVLAAAGCPVFFAPAMNAAMWENPALRRNIAILKKDGRLFVEPGSGGLACGDTGPGRMAEPEEIAGALRRSFEPGDMEGVKVVVTAGRTEEMIDPVRYISNRSSGRMGFALAAEAGSRGASVTLIHGPVDVSPPVVDRVRTVRTASEMRSEVRRAFPKCDVLVMAAAVADYAPARRGGAKIRRSGESLSVELRPTEDILAGLKGSKRKDQVVVGFALETEDAERNAREKIKNKGCDYLVLNVVGEESGFTVKTNSVTVFEGRRKVLSTPVVTKEEAASLILDKVAAGIRSRRRRR